MLRAGWTEVMGDFDQSGDPNFFTSTELFTMAFLDPTMAAIAGMFLAVYGISAVVQPVDALMQNCNHKLIFLWGGLKWIRY